MADLCGVLGQPMEDEVFLLEPFDDREPTHRDHQVVALDGFGERRAQRFGQVGGVFPTPPKP